MRRHFQTPGKLTTMCSFRASYLLNRPISQLIQRRGGHCSRILSHLDLYGVLLTPLTECSPRLTVFLLSGI
jgi:hypothetical protein